MLFLKIARLRHIGRVSQEANDKNGKLNIFVCTWCFNLCPSTFMGLPHKLEIKEGKGILNAERM